MVNIGIQWIFINNMTIELLSGDCLEILKTIKEVDAVITDPPYCVANKNIIKFKTRKNMSSDFGTWDYFTEEDYLKFTKQWMELAIEKLKLDGNFITFSRLENITDFKRIYESLGLTHHAVIIWHKTNPSPRVRKTGFLSSCEAILWGVKESDSKKKQYTFNFTKQNEMHNHIETPICMGKERSKHPTQKPLPLINKLVSTFTKEGDTVLDCFAGSGTTGISCQQLNRSSILIEKDPSSLDIIKVRLSI